MKFLTRLMLASASYFFAVSAFAGTPTVNNGLPSDSFVGEQVCFDISLANSSATVGYGPYIRLDLPAELSFDSASFLSVGITEVDLGIFPVGGQLTDPKSDTTVSSVEGNQLYLLPLPIGSVVQNGPALTTNVCVTIDTGATVGNALSVAVTPVFEFGDTATGVNGAIAGTPDTQNITPTLHLLAAANEAEGGKAVPGPSFPQSLADVIDVANGQTTHNIVQNINLDANFQYLNASASATGGTGASIDSTPSSLSPGGNLSASYSSATGTTATELNIGLQGYVIDILDESVCSAETLSFTSTTDAEYPAGTGLPQLSESHNFSAKHLVIYQSVATSSNVPGATATITNTIKVSDYATVNSLVVDDVLADGFTFGSHTSLTVNGTPVAITPVVMANGDGSYSLAYDIGAETGNISGGSTIVLQYSATLDQNFNDSSPILASDALATSTQATYGLTAGATACNDNDGASVAISPVSSGIEILLPKSEYAPGDTITFRQHLEVASGDTSGIVFETFFPLPVFDVASLNLTYGNDITAAATDTLALNPTSITVDAATNKLRIEWPDVTTISTQTLAVDIALTIEDDPFADNLHLTSLFQASTDNSNPVTSVATSPAAIKVRAPELVIAHGVVSSDNPVADGTITASTPIDSDISQSDAGDKLTFQILVENIGGASAYDVVITDTLPTGLINGAVTSVTDGSGNNLTYSGDLFGAGLALTPELQKNDGSQGSPYTNDTVVITYTADIDSSVNAGESLTNSANVSWSSASSAIKFSAQSDDTNINMARPDIALSIDDFQPKGGITNVVVGDVITYRGTVTLPEGTTPDLTLDIDLPAGLEYQAASTAIDTTGFAGTVDSSPTVTPSGAVATGQSLAIAFDSPANTLVTNDNNAANNSFDFTFDVVVTDDSALDAVSSLQNISVDSSLNYTGQSGGAISDNATTNFAEHNLAVTSSMSPSSGLSQGDTVTISVTVENTGTAPAYDLALTDVINADLFDLTSVVEGTTPAGYSYNYANPNVSIAADNNTALAAGASVTFTYTAVVKAGVVTGSSYSNNLGVNADSQEGVAANPERSNNASDTPSAMVNALEPASLVIDSTSESWTTETANNADMAIGEVATLVLTINVPEGVSNEDGSNAIISAALPAGVSYIPNTAQIKQTNGTALTASNLIGGLSPIPSTYTDVSTHVAVNGNNLDFDLGNITNTDDDADVETIELSFDVLILNTLDNNRADAKNVSAQVNYNNFAGNPQSDTVDTPVSLTVVEPNLVVTKTPSTSTISGGDSVSFTVVLTNQSSVSAARGWEWQLTDTLPSRLENLILVSATLSRGSADISGCASDAGHTISLDSSCLAASESYLDAGENITLVYSADVDDSVGFEEQITNTANARITSLPGNKGTADTTPGAADSDTGERTGSGNTNTSAQAVNDLSATASATITADKPSINLNIAAADLPILATTTISSTIAVPTGTTDNFVFTYDLPTGLTYTGTPVVITEPSADYVSTNAPAVNLVQGTDPLVFDFGTVTNSDSSSQNITLTIEVEVDNILANQAGTSLPVGASLSYAGVSTPPSASQNISVVEPELAITKAIVAGATGSDAGDTISYQIVVTNNAMNATAYQVNLQDIVPAELTGAPDGTGSGNTFVNLSLTNTGNLAVLTGSATVLDSSHALINTTNVSNDTLAWQLFDLPATASLTISYDVVVANSAVAGDTLTNNISASYNSLVSGLGRDSSDNGDDDDDSKLNNYFESASQSLTVDSSLAIQNTLTTGQASSNFTIGETVSFDARIDLVEGQTGNLVLNYELPAGLTYESSSIIADSNISYSGAALPAQSGQTLTFNLGDINNIADLNAANDYLIARIIAKVADDVGNTSGTNLTATGDLTSDIGNAGPDNEQITIVEPNLTLTLTPATTNVTLGDTVLITAVVEHSGSSTADAHDVSFNLDLPSGLNFVTASHSGQGSLDDANPASLAIDLGAITTTESSKTFTFEVEVDSSTAVEQVLNIASSSGQYSTLATDIVGERIYSLAATTNLTAKDSSFIDVTHQVTTVADNGVAGVLDAGDELQYTITITNTGDAVTDAIYTEVIPNNTSYNATNPATSSKGSVDSASLPTLEFDIGAMAMGETVTLTYNVILDAGVAAGTQIRAQGQVDSSLTIPELSDNDGNDANGDQATIVYVEDSSSLDDALYIQLTANWLNDNDANNQVSPGDTIELTYFIQNLSSTELTNVTVDETLPTGVSFVNASALIDGANTINVAAGNLDIDIANLAGYDTIVATYQVTIDNPLVDLNGSATEEIFSHSATGNSDQTPATESDANGIQSDGNQPAVYTAVSGASAAPDVNVYLDWTLINDVDGDGQVDPGDEVLYQFTIVNSGSTVAENTRLEDAIPTNTSLVAGSGFTSQGIIINDAPFELNIGDLAPGEVINAGFVVIVDAGTADGTVISNQGLVSGDNFSDQDSDNNADASDGLNATEFVVVAPIVVPPVTPPTDDPIEAIDDSVAIEEGASIQLTPLANDKGEGELTLTSATATNGTVTIEADGTITYTPNANFVGDDVISYCIEDSTGATDCAVINVTVTPVNDAPTAADDTATINSNETAVIAVLENDSDVDGDELIITSINASVGTVVINDDGTISYTPPTDFTGEVTFTYTLADGTGSDALTSTATVTITVDAPVVEDNLAPQANDDSVTVSSWSPVTINPLSNDSDPDGDDIELVSAQAAVGTVEIVNGEIVYTPVAGYLGEVTFEYLIKDSNGATDTATITINFDIADSELLPQINVPADLCGDLMVDANALYTRVELGTATAIDRFGNPLPVSLINNGLLFPPGINTAYWQATDAEGRTSVAAQKVCVRPLVSLKKDQVVLEGESVTVGVYLNGQSEVYPLTVGYQLSGTAEQDDYVLGAGEIVIASGTDAEISLDINLDDLAEDDETIVFTLVPELNRGVKHQHTVTITEANIAPQVELTAMQAGFERLTVAQDSNLVTISADVYDANQGDTVSYLWSSSLSNESTSEEQFVFNPALVSPGIYQVNVKVTDNGMPALDDEAVIYLHVVASLPVLTSADSDGDLIPDNLEGFKDQDGDGIPDYLDRIPECNVLTEHSTIQNQYLVEGDPGVCLRRGETTFLASTGGAHITEEDVAEQGVLPQDTQAVNVGGIMDFVAYGLPQASQLYRISTPLRNPVPANAVYRKYRADIGWTDFVEDDNNQLWSTQGEPGYCPPPGSDLWTPGLTEGDWCVQLTIEDGGPNDDDGLRNGTIVDPGYVGTKLSGNLLPVAVDDSLMLHYNGDAYVDVMANDSDADGDSLTIVSAVASFGTVTIENGQLYYQAPADIVGQDTIHYGISDSVSGTDYGVVNVTILANTPPIALDDTVEVIQGEQVDISVLNNDSDPDDDTIRVISATAANGQVAIGEDGVLTYTPNNGFSGQDTINYQITDSAGETANAVVYITVIERFEVGASTTSSGGAINLWLMVWGLMIMLWRNHQLFQQVVTRRIKK